ncbi:Niemann-Pick C1 protein [Papilio machaon]|uniref:Niemann-Pick C1 protein n=1 Tax=Papilio machaon TaxID=76193 RepID=A0A194RMG1_PAPMA|nr:Niemann-Pick C1 protein [Papilio machaon]
MTCAPNQSKFLKPVRTSLNKDKKEQIEEIDYHLGATYMNSTFDSCLQVQMPSSNQRALDLMCGSWGAAYCTPQRWFDFMGDASTGLVPFQINYISGDEPVDQFVPYQPPTRSCSASINGQPGCSCLDCAASCPVPPPRPPPHRPFTIMGTDGYAFVMAIIFLIFSTLFLSGVYCCNPNENQVDDWARGGEDVRGGSETSPLHSHRSSVASDTNQEMSTNPTSVGWTADQADGAADATFFERLGAETETRLEDFFQWWGCIMAFRPWIVLFLALGNETKLEDICFAPLQSQFSAATTSSVCAVQSIWGWWGNSRDNLLDNLEDNQYLDTVLSCASNPYLCLAPYGGPVLPGVALGGFLAPGEPLTSTSRFHQADALIITILVNNKHDTSQLKPALEWEKKFIEFMKNYTENEMPSYMDIAYTSERSIEDELDRESQSDVSTILVSYFIMFAYIAISLGRFTTCSRLLIDSKVTLGLGGVLIVLASVVCSVGMFGYAGVAATLIIVEVIPFLVLAVGVDNIFILVQTSQREPRRPNETVAEHIGRTLGQVGPSMFLTSVSESVCFFLGALSDMPAVRAFALYAGAALLVDFLLQVTCFVALLAIDTHRQNANRYADIRLKPALEWEKKFIEFMKNYTENEMPSYMDIAYTSERSIEDELDRESQSDVSTILVSYFIMFAYIAISLGRFTTCSRLLIDSKVTLGLGGVLIVLASVVCSVGMFGYAGVAATLIIVEVIPFLVLAVGVDNIFILVQTSQREPRRPNETVAEHIGRTLGQVGPSMFLTSVSESVCFFLGALSDMPAVRAFALYAGAALLVDFLLQVTCFVALLAIDTHRQNANRFDVLCCLSGSKAEGAVGAGEGALYKLFQHAYVPFLMRREVRATVMIVFFAWLCSSVAVAPHIEIGLDQELSMPQDSFQLKYFQHLNKYLNIGPPVYFVLMDGLDFSRRDAQNMVCGTRFCNSDSLSMQLYGAYLSSNETYLAQAPNSWLDDFFDWSASPDCCRYFPANSSFCPNSYTSCKRCNIPLEGPEQRPNASNFEHYVPFFLQDNPTPSCPKGGHAAYSQAVNYKYKNKTKIGATFYQGYHTVLKTSYDYYSALRSARTVAANLTETMNRHLKSMNETTTVNVFPYSVFYVFYEQYLTMWPDTLKSMGISVLSIFIVTFILMGFDLFSALVVVITITMIVVNIGGLMYWWGISLNAVSLVNLAGNVMPFPGSPINKQKLAKQLLRGKELGVAETSLTRDLKRLGNTALNSHQNHSLKKADLKGITRRRGRWRVSGRGRAYGSLDNQPEPHASSSEPLTNEM